MNKQLNKFTINVRTNAHMKVAQNQQNRTIVINGKNIEVVVTQALNNLSCGMNNGSMIIRISYIVDGVKISLAKLEKLLASE